MLYFEAKNKRKYWKRREFWLNPSVATLHMYLPHHDPWAWYKAPAPTPPFSYFIWLLATIDSQLQGNETVPGWLLNRIAICLESIPPFFGRNNPVKVTLTWAHCHLRICDKTLFGTFRRKNDFVTTILLQFLVLWDYLWCTYDHNSQEKSYYSYDKCLNSLNYLQFRKGTILVKLKFGLF